MQNKKRSGNISQEQKSTLVNFLNNHPELLSGKFTNEFTYKTAQQLWKNITDQLNSIPGANKDLRHWRKTWQDIRTATKLKCSKHNKEINKTGGGQLDPSLQVSEMDSQILNLIKSVCTNGHNNILESQVCFNFDDSFEKEVQPHLEQRIENQIPELNEVPAGTSNDHIENTPHKSSSNIFKSASTRSKSVYRASDAASTLARTAEAKLAEKSKYATAKLALLERIVVSKQKKKNLLLDEQNKILKEQVQVLSEIKDVINEILL